MSPLTTPVQNVLKILANKKEKEIKATHVGKGDIKLSSKMKCLSWENLHESTTTKSWN